MLVTVFHNSRTAVRDIGKPRKRGEGYPELSASAAAVAAATAAVRGAAAAVAAAATAVAAAAAVAAGRATAGGRGAAGGAGRAAGRAAGADTTEKRKRAPDAVTSVRDSG